MSVSSEFLRTNFFSCVLLYILATNCGDKHFLEKTFVLNLLNLPEKLSWFATELLTTTFLDLCYGLYTTRCLFYRFQRMILLHRNTFK